MSYDQEEKVESLDDKDMNGSDAEQKNCLSPTTLARNYTDIGVYIVHLRQLSADNLPKRLDNDPPSPYLSIHANGKKCKTKVIDDSCYPAWDDTFVFAFTSNPQTITFVVKDKHGKGPSMDEVIGKTEFSCVKLFELESSVIEDGLTVPLPLNGDPSLAFGTLQVTMNLETLYPVQAQREVRCARTQVHFYGYCHGLNKLVLRSRVGFVNVS